MKICSKCEKEFDDEMLFCPWCGTKYEEKPKVKICFSCGRELLDEMRFCGYCGCDTLSRDENKDDVKESMNLSKENMKSQEKNCNDSNSTTVLQQPDATVLCNEKTRIDKSEHPKTLECPKCGNVQDWDDYTCAKCGHNLFQCKKRIVDFQQQEKKEQTVENPTERILIDEAEPVENISERPKYIICPKCGRKQLWENKKCCICYCALHDDVPGKDETMVQGMDMKNDSKKNDVIQDRVIYCTECGTKNDFDAKFCKGCGCKMN